MIIYCQTPLRGICMQSERGHNCLRRLRVGCLKRMAVNVKRRSRVGMTQPFLYRFDIAAAVYQNARV